MVTRRYSTTTTTGSTWVGTATTSVPSGGWARVDVSEPEPPKRKKKFKPLCGICALKGRHCKKHQREKERKYYE